MESVFDKIIEAFDTKGPKKWIKTNKPIEEKRIDLKVFLRDWLLEAAKGIYGDPKKISYGMSFSTHPCRFIHPDSAKFEFAKSKKGSPKELPTLPVIAECKYSCDGYVRSGNVFDVKCDAYGNAACFPYYNFLQIKLEDGLTIFQHIEKNTPEAKMILSLADSKDYDEIRSLFLSISNRKEIVTNNKIKQIYFPVPNDDYHLLSVLMPSGIMSKLKEKINNTKFGDENKELREKRKNNEYSDKTITEYPDLTIVGFGGANKQNISIINNDNEGRFYFLPSFPPALDEDKIKTPARSFFNECLRYKYYASEFKAWQKLLKVGGPDCKRKDLREGRNKIIQSIFDDILQRCFIIRSAVEGWSDEPRCVDLPKNEKLLLDKKYDGQRNDAEDELKEFIKKAVRWVIKAFESINGKEAVKMFDEELKYYIGLIEEQAEVLLC